MDHATAETAIVGVIKARSAPDPGHRYRTFNSPQVAARAGDAQYAVGGPAVLVPRELICEQVEGIELQPIPVPTYATVIVETAKYDSPLRVPWVSMVNTASQSGMTLMLLVHVCWNVVGVDEPVQRKVGSFSIECPVQRVSTEVVVLLNAPVQSYVLSWTVQIPAHSAGTVMAPAIPIGSS